jgi:hypothetical protein
MAGLLPAIHAVRRIERLPANSNRKNLPDGRPLLPTPGTPLSSFPWRCVDGRDKPGHDGEGLKTVRQAVKQSRQILYDFQNAAYHDLKRGAGAQS